jgi:LysR family glycine cleavage system transcriptional activator
LSEAFERIAHAVAQVGRTERAGVLTVSVEPSFAARWLVLRLGRFRAAHPGIELRLSPSETPVDLEREDVDLAVRHGRGGWPGLRADLLMHARVFPVCSPGLLAVGPPLAEPADLRHHTLLHEDSDTYWPDWLAAAGASEVEASRGPRFATAHLALAAAAADLAEGRLVRLFAIEIATDQGYWLMAPVRSCGRPKVEAFRAWLLGEARGEKPG